MRSLPGVLSGRGPKDREGAQVPEPSPSGYIAPGIDTRRTKVSREIDRI